MNKPATLILAAAMALTGCATRPGGAWQPIIDPAIGDQSALPAALAECRQLAAQVDAGQSAAAGAVAGALLGAAFAAILGARGANIGRTAAATGLGTATGSAVNAGLTQKQIIERCLANRGFAVLR